MPHGFVRHVFLRVSQAAPSGLGYAGPVGNGLDNGNA
jgi:hypothetical protein